ncbi:hypothetical protein MnTg02_02804 [bacterium MnTg02]|nr:hypothetical protein MnTg02_02804 [bacterium MnTg02]
MSSIWLISSASGEVAVNNIRNNPLRPDKKQHLPLIRALNDPRRDAKTKQSMSFRKFVEGACSKPLYEQNKHWRPQYDSKRSI